MCLLSVPSWHSFSSKLTLIWHSIWPIFRVLVLSPVNLLESNLWTINLLDFINWAITYATFVSSFIVFWVFLICILWKLLWLKTKVFLLQLLLVYQNHFYWLLWASNEFAYRTWLWHFQKFHFKNHNNFIRRKISKFYLFLILIFLKNLEVLYSEPEELFRKRGHWSESVQAWLCVYSNQPWIKYFIFWFYFIIFSLSNCIYFNCLSIIILWIEV